MDKLLFLSQEDLLKAGCFNPQRALSVTEQAVKKYAEGSVLYPDKVCQVFDKKTHNRINCLPATLLDEQICGAKWISVFPENPKLFSKPNISSLTILSEIETGFPIAVLESGLCSALRTASVGALAAKYLANPDAEIIGFIGAGEEAKMHFITMKNVLKNLKVCKVASRRNESEQKFIDTLSKLYPDVTFIACNANYEKAASDSDVIVTAISGQNPILKAEWVKQGAFYCHVGGLEDEDAVALAADKIVCDNWNMVKHRTQTISLLYQKGILSDGDIYADLDEIVSGKKPGRTSKDEFTYFNSVGLSYVDIAIAYDMYQTAKSLNLGQEIISRNHSVFDYDLKRDGTENILNI